MSLDINLTNVESTTNKKTNLTDNSDTFYPTQKAVKTALDGKVDKVTGKGLSENDFTNTLKTKLDGIQDGAEVNVNADWNATSGDAQILNKPTIPDASVFVEKSDYTPAHSILAQQSGTGSPSAVTIGTNEILGREGGGGADIKGLSASEVKAILAFTKAEIMAGLEMEEIFVTGDQTTTSTTAVNITDLVTTTLTAGKYKINGTIGVGSSSTAGLKLGVILPTGATMKLKGLDRGSTTANSITEIFTTSNTLSTGNFCPTNGESIVNINGTITIGATSGVVQFIFAKTTSGTATINDEGTQITIEKL